MDTGQGRLPVAALVAVAILAGTTTSATAVDLADYGWQAVVQQPAPPPARRDPALVFDRARGRLILFGGLGQGGDLDTTWAFDLASSTWSELAIAPATRPQPRHSMVAGLDAERDRVLVSTGQGTMFYDDIWSLDLITDTWSEVNAAGGPPARRYGSAGGALNFAGQASPSALYLSHGFTFAGRFDDAWAFDMATDTWRDASPAGPTPIPRCLHAATMIAAGRMVLFGGCGSPAGCPLDDIWLFDESAGTWTDLSTAGGPSARTFPALAATADGTAVLLFGGDGSGVRNDLWRFDVSAPSWQLLTPTNPPPARDGHAMVWVDGAHAVGGCGVLYAFGGDGSSGLRDDLWRLQPEAAAVIPTIYAVDAAGDVELSWAHDPSNGGYELWRDTVPDFATAVLLTEPITISAGTAMVTDTTAPGTGQVYYRVVPLLCP